MPMKKNRFVHAICPHCGAAGMNRYTLLIAAQMSRESRCSLCGKPSTYGKGIVNATTFAGALGIIISIILSIDPHAQIFDPVRFVLCLLGVIVLLVIVLGFARLRPLPD